MSQMAKHCKAQKAAASGCIRQGNAREDGEAQNLCVPCGQGLLLGQRAQEHGAKIEGTRETSPRYSGKLKKSLEVDRSECCCL